MLSRRSFVALPAIVPMPGGRQPRLDIRDVQHEPLDVGATTILSISPDGGVLMGVQFRNRLCFLDAATLEVLALGETTEEMQLIDRASVHWSPDGSRIAFSLDAWRRMTDSDIFIADVETAAITNLTAEGDDDEAASLLDAADVRIDLYPRWIDDGTLVFARHGGIEGGDSTCTLCTLNPETQTVETLVSLDTHGYRFVDSPPLLLNPGSMLMTLRGGSQPTEIVMVEPDGTVTNVGIDGARAPQLIAASETQVLVWDVEAFELVIAPLDDPAAAMPFADVFDYGDGYRFFGRPAIASTPDAYAGVALSTTSEKIRVFTVTDGERRDLGHLNGEVTDPACHLVGDRLLISDLRNAWLIDLGT